MKGIPFVPHVLLVLDAGLRFYSASGLRCCCREDRPSRARCRAAVVLRGGVEGCGKRHFPGRDCSGEELVLDGNCS